MSPKVKSFGSCLCLDWFRRYVVLLMTVSLLILSKILSVSSQCFTFPLILILWNLNLLPVFWCSEADCCLITKIGLSVSVLLKVFSHRCTLYNRVYDCSQRVHMASKKRLSKQPCGISCVQFLSRKCASGVWYYYLLVQKNLYEALCEAE